MKNLFRSSIVIAQIFVINIIKLYQNTLSPDHGWRSTLFPFGYCRYKPTCSEYAIQAIEKYGLIKGGLKAAWRILRCNPWSKGGWDPVEKVVKSKK